jgi:hypothetical protein
MRHHLGAVLIALALMTAGAASTASAQTLQGNLNQPAVSPYINILRGGAPAGVNYYNLVQPQLQFYSAINQLQSQQQQQGPTSFNSQGLLVTGHSVQFSNYSHFYPQLAQGPSTGIRRPPYQTQQQSQGNRPLGTSPINPFQTQGKSR